jgi:transposase-like protein
MDNPTIERSMINIKVKGEWVYLYRAVDSHGDTLDFMLSERRDEEAATAFFKQAINNNGFPDFMKTGKEEGIISKIT